MDQEVTCLLRQWGLEAYIPKFMENNITSLEMVLLGEKDIRELFSSIGHRVLFTKNLEAYKKLIFPEPETENVLPTKLSDVTIDSLSTIEFPLNEVITFTTEASGNLEKQRDNKSLKETNETSTLAELLKHTIEGKNLLSVSKTTPLDNASRLQIVRLIATYILRNQPERNITADIYSYWTNQIVELFTEEKRAVYLHTKLVQTGRGIAKRLVGKLPDQIKNLKTKYRDLGIIAKRPRCTFPSASFLCLSPSSPLSRIQVINVDAQSDTDCEESLHWLRNSSHSWDLVEEKWGETLHARLVKLKYMTIDDYYKEFPALQKPNGYLLLQKDFKTIYPSNFNGLKEKFPAYKKRLFNIAASRPGKDKYILNMLSLQNSSEEISNLAALLLIPSLLTVSTLRLKGANKKVWRPSKHEVREGFITHLTSDAVVAEAISSRRMKLKDFNLTPQPLVVVVGESLSEIISYIVIVNDIKYYVSNIIDAVDTCLKIIFTLNAKYADESSSAWMFVQYGFYKIKTKYDKTSTATSTLLVELGIEDIDIEDE